MNIEHAAKSKLFIGFDIHKRSWKIYCSTNISGRKTFSMSPSTEGLSAEGLSDYMDMHFP